MRYLDPKNDLTFKKVFGQHPHLLVSFLNALLPLDAPIISVEYLPHELVPEIPVLKYSIVDVRCTDQNERQFIVEMQMLWTDAFKSRVLFNASKAYVQQLGKGKVYESLQPVYSLNLVNETFEPTITDFYHHYKIVHQQYPDKFLKGLELVFIELPKFKAKNISERKMQLLWLRFMTEIEDSSEEIPEELMQNPIIKEAVDYLQESGFTKGELATYDKYWDDIRSEMTLMNAAKAEGLAEGREEGIKEGREEGIKEGIIEGIEEGKKITMLEIAKKAIENGLTNDFIKQFTGLTDNEIDNLRNS
jgi:predicted transposase/invertase (TIGR01784 family)